MFDKLKKRPAKDGNGQGSDNGFESKDMDMDDAIKEKLKALRKDANDSAYEEEREAERERSRSGGCGCGW